MVNEQFLNGVDGVDASYERITYNIHKLNLKILYKIVNYLFNISVTWRI